MRRIRDGTAPNLIKTTNFIKADVRSAEKISDENGDNLISPIMIKALGEPRDFLLQKFSRFYSSVNVDFR